MRGRRDLFDMAFALLLAGVSLYPLYRDDIARWRNWAEQKIRRPRCDEALPQVQKEISLMEHGTFGLSDGA